MADGKSQNTSSVNPGPLVKGMVKDMDDSYSPEGTWYHARNAMPNSRDGNLGTLANEPSNLHCANIPYTVIGCIHLYKDVWAVFSTDDTNSEIGTFDEGQCIYTPLRNSLGQDMNPVNCLGFKRSNLIIGVAKENSDCTWQVYWADGRLNPDRTVNVTKPAFVENCVTVNNCQICTPTTALDCDALRLTPLVTVPCVSVSRGPNGGSLLNGSYYAVIAYTLNGQRVTDYYMPSNTQSIFEHDNAAGSLVITVNQMDTDHFDYFELVIVRTINAQTSAKKIGIYSTRQAQISLDNIAESLESVPVEFIPLRSPNYEKSDGIFEVGQYMLRTGPQARFNFNYQPLANRITAKWKAVAYPSNYYGKGGNTTSYLRDEVYPFFIRWVYNTGEKSASYHIPGRPSRASDLAPVSIPNAIEINDPIAPYIPQKWEVENTAPGSVPLLPTTLADGGILFAEGEMGYWQSTELYPDTKPDIFNASAHPFSAITTPPYPGTSIVQYDLCGQPIRHHKFPENKVIPHFRNNPLSPADQQIIVLGVEFDNILPPVDNQGVLIPGIVGYEILRGSREGNKTVIAKGIINNMRTYPLDNGQVGLYQNYPYNPLGLNPALSPSENPGGWTATSDQGPAGGTASTAPSTNQFTFHSPDTQFNNPFLSSRELKIYGELFGDVLGSFDEQPGHPKEKLLTDIAFIVAAFVGVGAAILAVRGQKTNTRNYPFYNNQGHSGLMTLAGATVGVGNWATPGLAGLPAAVPGFIAAFNLNTTAANAIENQQNSPANVVTALFNKDAVETTAMPATATPIVNTPGVEGFQNIRSIEASQHSYLPTTVKILQGVTLFSQYWIMGTEAAMDLIRAAVPYTQYVMRYTSHGFSNNYQVPQAGIQFRHLLTNAIYLDDGFQDFGENNNAKINNIYRGRCVALQTFGSVANPVAVVDNTIQTIGSCVKGGFGLAAGTLPSFAPTDVKSQITTQTTSHYAALKNRMRNQYGQVDSIIEVPASYCPVTVNPMVAGTPVTQLGSTTTNSGPIFSGDTYIGRYTEKNTFFYFWEWLYDQPNGYEFNYKLRYMMNYPRYWANFEKYDPNEFLNSFVSNLFSGTSPSLPNDRARLDRDLLPTGGGFGSSITSLLLGLFRITNSYFYTFHSGIRDFFVESEINIDQRDWGDPLSERHYDPYRYTDVRSLFDPKIIKSGNFFKYDQSLSVSRVFNNFFSWGNTQERDYDPITAETCYTYYPNRLIYSLPQQLEARKDFWRVFLANNYKDFKSRITSVKPVNKTGAMIMFQTESPAMFQGVDELQTELGTKVTVGDGSLFRRDPQSIVNTDASYEYASCQDRLSVINTKYGLFWVSQNQGKIFNYSDGLHEISRQGLWFWISTYLPYKLVEDFPTFELLDNPVVGIGCQSIYDNQEDTLYFTKKDYKLKPQYVGQVSYVGSNNFMIGGLQIKLGDPLYFDDASWTLSYDPQDKIWLSFHDWHPDLTMPGKNEFLSIVHDPVTNVGSIWRHNARTDSFCNFYGIDYPFEIDRIAQTGPTVTTMRSVEYYMEAYIYHQPDEDIYEVLDANFDHAVIYNREQVSGILILNQMPKNNVSQRLLYPIVGPTSIDILVDKVEQKYRFNQFWDITADRGEFTFPNVQRPIWITSINGYVRDLNPANLNYQKSPFQRKKFRHYANHVRLYKNISGNINYIVKLVNVKELVSSR